MAIETLEDYNAQSCCCDQTLCPIPEEVCQSIFSRVTTTYYFGHFSNATGTRYNKEITTYTGCSYESTDTLDGFYNFFYPDGSTQLDNTVLTTTNNGQPFTGCTDPVIALSDPITWADWMTGAEAGLDTNFAGVVDANWTGSACAAAKTGAPSYVVDGGNDASFYLEKEWSRTRWKIPATWSDQVTGLSVPFTGTYFLFTYDIIEEPDGWDDPTPAVFRSFYLEDQTIEWTGAGTGDEDDASWLTDWIYINPPEVSGTRRIVNRRLVCREDWGLGVLPQVWGEAVTLPD